LDNSRIKPLRLKVEYKSSGTFTTFTRKNVPRTCFNR